jgi:hypothetical protein
MGGKPRKDTPRDMRLAENKRAQQKEIARGIIRKTSKTKK